MSSLRLTLVLLIALMGNAKAAPVMTADGAVEGITRNHVREFRGLPYAAPPVGALRWMPPQPAGKWTGVRQAKAFGPACAQIATMGPFAGPATANEDCLYLNIYTPDTKTKLPVLLWVHGGGSVTGEGNHYDGSKLAADGKLVVVTINYRLTLFGFLAHPALDSEGHAFGNYGIMDIQAALRWVKRNIANFGGDPNNVTLAGHSAGASAVMANVISPGSAGLFHRAIFTSGNSIPFTALAKTEERGRNFAIAAGCTKGDVAKCLRALPASKVLALSGTRLGNGPFHNGQMLDGNVIPTQAIDAFNSGKFNRMPIMIGTTQDEGNLAIGVEQYLKYPARPTSETDFRNYVTRTYGSHAEGGIEPPYPKNTVSRVLMQYPIKTTALDAWNAAATDIRPCRAQVVAQALSAHVPVFTYEFADRTAPSFFPKMPGFRALAYHAGDLPYLFVGYHGGPEGVPTSLTAKQELLSTHLITAWANFARTGNPNGAGNTPWPRWKKDGPAVFLQDDSWRRAQTSVEFSAAHQCDFWKSVHFWR